MDYRVETGLQPNGDWNAFYRFIGDSIVSKFSKDQLLGKISKLKRKFLVQFEKINQGNDPLFTKFNDPKAYEFSSMIWGQNESQFAAYSVNKHNDNCIVLLNQEKTPREDEQVANAELLNENVAEKTDFNDKITESETTAKESDDNDSFREDEQVANAEPEKEATGRESNENDIVADELCIVVDAYDTLISQDLSSNVKKMQAEKLMKTGNEKRKEISKEWKEVCAEKTKLKMKKLRLAVKLAEAVNES